MKALVIFVLAALTACDRAPEPQQTQQMPQMNESQQTQRMQDIMRHAATAVVDTVGLRTLAVPAEFQSGQEVFLANCARCHGEAALGTEQGPPLVHIYYEPNHHADSTFVIAAQRGVRQHHWPFGDMPPRPEVSAEEVMEIVGYIRWLQREAGVY